MSDNYDITFISISHHRVVVEICGINVVRKTHKRHELIRKNAKGLGKSIFLRIINGLGEAKALINEIDDSRLRLAEIMLTLIAGR